MDESGEWQSTASLEEGIPNFSDGTITDVSPIARSYLSWDRRRHIIRPYTALDATADEIEVDYLCYNVAKETVQDGDIQAQ